MPQGVHGNVANHRIIVRDDVILRGIDVLDGPLLGACNDDARELSQMLLGECR